MNDNDVRLSCCKRLETSLKYHKASDKGKVILDYQDWFFNRIKNAIKYIADAFSSNIAIVN